MSVGANASEMSMACVALKRKKPQQADQTPEQNQKPDGMGGRIQSKMHIAGKSCRQIGLCVVEHVMRAVSESKIAEKKKPTNDKWAQRRQMVKELNRKPHRFFVEKIK